MYFFGNSVAEERPMGRLTGLGEGLRDGAYLGHAAGVRESTLGGGVGDVAREVCDVCAAR